MNLIDEQPCACEAHGDVQHPYCIFTWPDGHTKKLYYREDMDEIHMLAEHMRINL